jgi:KDO2-lipid IV(A) lauroyltransferase
MSKARFQKTPLHYFQYLALKTFCVLFSLLPYRLSIALSRRLTGAVRFVMPKRFKRTIYDISRAFPEKTAKETHQIALESWRNMGAIMAEFIQLSNMTPENFKKHCRVEGMEKIFDAEGKTGGIIHIGHFTNWEAFGLAASIYGADKAVLAQRVDNPYVDEEINRLRNIFSGQTFYSNHEFKPFFACMRWLKKKKVLGILFDQNTISSEIWLPFMGRTSATSPITALLSIKMQVPVFPVKVSREKDGTILCTIMDPVLPPQEYSMENVRQFTKTLVSYYEQFLREDPASWLWAHNRWKREAEGNLYLEQHPEERI